MTTGNERGGGLTFTAARPTSRRRRNESSGPKTVFKVIIASEIVFLVTLWRFVPLAPSPNPWMMPSSQSYSDFQHNRRNTRRRNNVTDISQFHHNGMSDDGDTKRSSFQIQQERKRRQKEMTGSNSADDYQNLPILVIGGSDGSGTRSFADAVRSLGVPMKTDLISNLDVQSSDIFRGEGFPTLVNFVLQETRSVNYEVSNLTNETRTTALLETRKFKHGVDRWFRRALHAKRGTRAQGVAYGMKAPALMILLPLLKELFGPIKFIHVVRDGRDVSLSANQSPVLKFYNSSYADAAARRAKYSNGSEPVLAMHLWNDWNIQALEWEKSHAKDDDFDYLVMRSEDLVDPLKKFEALAQLADFVGSRMTAKEICCLSRRDAVDLGQSVRWTGAKKKDARRAALERIKQPKSEPVVQKKYGSLQGKAWDSLYELRREMKNPLWNYHSHRGDLKERKEPKPKQAQQDGTADATLKLQERYGKWRVMLKDKPELSVKLHEEGSAGLATFGYEPRQAHITDLDKAVAGVFSCDETVVCGPRPSLGPMVVL